MQQLPDSKKQSRRLLIIAVTLLIGLATSLAACSNQPAGTTAEIGQESILEPGQKVLYSDESLEIRFVEVVNDSRCPTGVQCIWAGEVSVKIEINYQDQQKSMVLTQSGSSDAQTLFLDYTIAFAIQPYPEAQKPIKAKDYRLHLVVTKEAEITGG